MLFQRPMARPSWPMRPGWKQSSGDKYDSVHVRRSGGVETIGDAHAGSERLNNNGEFLGLFGLEFFPKNRDGVSV